MTDTTNDTENYTEALTLVEAMPYSLRASHEAAGNRGTYPHNGAVRRVMSLISAIAADIDPWVRIVRAATDADVETYGRDDTLTDWL